MPHLSVSRPTWFPPAGVLELVELAAVGAIRAVPASALSERPPEVLAAGAALIEDAEGTDVAELVIAPDGSASVVGRRPFAHGPLRSRRRTPGSVRAELAGRPALAAAVTAVPGATPTAVQVRALRRAAADAGAVLVWLVVTGPGRPGPRDGGLTPEGTWRAVRALAAEGEPVVALALPAGHDDLLGEIARAHGAELLAEPATGPVHPAFAVELARAVRPAAERGLVVFFTGLSGSGKSTVAKALAEALADDGRRTVSLLDGDEVRRLLSAGLGFGAADRDANIRRIGFVAAEIARHGGVALCAPIAPFAATRAQVRSMVEAAGGDLVLVHVATPLAECERRDRKGLYARARRGEIPEFTGISSPYEEPSDADVVLDTTDASVEECVRLLWGRLQRGGYLVDDASEDAGEG